MIVQEQIIREFDGQVLIRTYSDIGMMIRQNKTGIEYTEAIDVPNRYTYTETDNPIQETEQEDEI